MTEEKIKEYYRLLDMFSVSILASKRLQENDIIYKEQIAALNEFIYRELLKFGVNNIGLAE